MMVFPKEIPIQRLILFIRIHSTYQDGDHNWPKKLSQPSQSYFLQINQKVAIGFSSRIYSNTVVGITCFCLLLWTFPIQRSLPHLGPNEAYVHTIGVSHFRISIVLLLNALKDKTTCTQQYLVKLVIKTTFIEEIITYQCSTIASQGKPLF